MKKDSIKYFEKINPENIKKKLNSQNDTYFLYLNSLFSDIKSLQKLYTSHNIIKEKNSKEKINSYFSNIFCSINLLFEEKDKIVSNYESLLRCNEQKIRILYSDIFNLKIKNTFLENNVEILLKKEKEYKLVKEKTGVLVENGVIIYNNKKENEIFILRTENSTLKNVINKNEKDISEIKEKLKNEIENYDKKISNLNHRINQLKYKLKQSNQKTKGQSFSSNNLNNNENNNNLKLNFTANNSTNQSNNIKGIINGLNISNNNNNEMSFNKNNNCIKRKNEYILLNKNIQKREKNLINSNVKSICLVNRSSSGQIKLKNKVIKKIYQDEATPNTFHNEINISNINISPIHSKKMLCLTPKINGGNSDVNFQTFQKISDKGKLKIIHNNCEIIKNCQSNKNTKGQNNLSVLKSLYNNNPKTKSKKNNNNIKSTQKIIKKELTWNNNLIMNNSVLLNTKQKRKIISNNENNIGINKKNNEKSPQYNLGKNKRKRNLIGNVIEKEHILPNKMSLSSIRKKNPINTSINSYGKNIFN